MNSCRSALFSLVMAWLMAGSLAGTTPAVQTADERLPDGVLYAIGTRRFRHLDAICALAFSPDGKTLATGGGQAQATRDYDKTIRIWEIPTGRKLLEINGHQAGVAGLAYSPDGNLLATAGIDSTVRIWETASGKERKKIEHPGEACFVAFVPGTDWLVTRSAQKVFVWDLATGKERFSLEDREHGIKAVAISPDSKILATAGITRQQQEEKRSPQEIERLKREGNRQASSGDGYSWGGVIHLVDLASCKEIQTIRDFDGPVGGIAFLPDGSSLMVASGRSLQLRDSKSGQKLKSIETKGSYSSFFSQLTVSNDGKAAALVGNDCLLINLQTTESHRIQSVFGNVKALSFSPDSSTLATGGEGGTAQFWEVATGHERKECATSFVLSADLSPDGKTLAARWTDGRLTLHSGLNGQETRTSGGEFIYNLLLQFSPDGRWLLHKKGDSIEIQDIETGQEVSRIKTEGNHVAVSPDRHRLACGDDGGKIRIFRIDTGEPPITIEVGHGYIYAVVISPTGDLLAAAGGGQGITLWDPADGRPTGISWKAEAPLAFSPDGSLLASCEGGKAIVLKNPKSGKEASRTLQGGAPITSLSFSSDGRYLAAGDSSKTVKIWEVMTGKEVTCFNAGGIPRWIRFFPDGKRLATHIALSPYRSEGQIMVWNLDRPELATLPSKPLSEELEPLWNLLGSEDASQADCALQSFVSNGETAVAFLGKHLAPARPVETEQVRKWIVDLSSTDAARRDAASRNLALYGGPFKTLLEQSLESASSTGVRARIGGILNSLETASPTPPESVRDLRAIHALEKIGTPTAIALLDVLAKGDSLAYSTIAAVDALNRCGKKRDGR